jgi:hypothetical protein
MPLTEFISTKSMSNNYFSTVVEILLFSKNFILELNNLRSKISRFVHICINHSRLFQIRTIYENLTF